MIEILVKLKDYVPLFETIVICIMIILLILIFLKQIRKIMQTITTRIENGSSLKAGPLEIGEVYKTLPHVSQSSKVEQNENSASLTMLDGYEREQYRVSIYEQNKGVFLTHILEPSGNPDTYEVYIYLIRHKSKNFHDIANTEFFFGHMWGNKIFKGVRNGEVIGLSTTAYEPFLCTCAITFADGSEITIHRYIDFEMMSIY